MRGRWRKRESQSWRGINPVLTSQLVWVHDISTTRRTTQKQIIMENRENKETRGQKSTMNDRLKTIWPCILVTIIFCLLPVGSLSICMIVSSLDDSRLCVLIPVLYYTPLLIFLCTWGKSYKKFQPDTSEDLPNYSEAIAMESKDKHYNCSNQKEKKDNCNEKDGHYNCSNQDDNLPPSYDQVCSLHM